MTSEGGRPIVRVHLGGGADGWSRMTMHQAISEAAEGGGTGDEYYERRDEMFYLFCFFLFSAVLGLPRPLHRLST